MGYQETGGFCPQCQRPALVRRPTPNHVLHLLITLLLCGLWLPVWALLSIQIGGWRCASCGSAARRELDAVGIVARVGLVAGAAFVALCCLVAILHTAMRERPASGAPTSEAPAPPAAADELAPLRANVGKTAFNKANGQEQGRIEGVAFEGKGTARTIVYRIRYRGQIRTHPADQTDVRDVPATVAE